MYSQILKKVFLSIWEFVSCSSFQVRFPNVFLSCWVEDVQLFICSLTAVAALLPGWLIIWVAGSKPFKLVLVLIAAVLYSLFLEFSTVFQFGRWFLCIKCGVKCFTNFLPSLKFFILCKCGGIIILIDDHVTLNSF